MQEVDVDTLHYTTFRPIGLIGETLVGHWSKEVLDQGMLVVDCCV